MPEPFPDAVPAPPPLVVRWLVAFGRFWVDFLIGDTPELFAGGALSVGAAAALAAAGERAAAAAVLPVLVLAALTASVLRARRRA